MDVECIINIFHGTWLVESNFSVCNVDWILILVETSGVASYNEYVFLISFLSSQKQVNHYWQYVTFGLTKVDLRQCETPCVGRSY